MKLLKLSARDVRSRARQRGYSDQEIAPCISQVLPGGWWVVDVESPHYPHKRRLERKPAASPVAPARVPLPGMGAQLTRVLAWLGITSTASCPCRKRAAQMDEWGLSQCWRRRAEICEWLAEEARKRRLRFIRPAGYALLACASLLFIADRLLRGNEQ